VRRRPWRALLAVRGAYAFGFALLLAVALFGSRLSERGAERNAFVALSLSAIVAVLARQFFTLRENERLNAELRALSSDLERRVEERTARLSALQALSSRLAAAGGVSQIPELRVEAAHLVARSLEVEYVSVVAYEVDGGPLRLLANSVAAEPLDVPLELIHGRPASRALTSMGPVIVEDGADELSRGLVECYGPGATSGISVVIRKHDGPFGVLNAYTARARRFSQADIAFAQSVANALGQATQRLMALEALRREHARTEHLLGSISQLLVGVSADGTVQLWNEAARATLQVEPAEVLGRPFRAVPLGWRWADVEETVRECLRERRPARVDDVRYVAGDGAELYLNLVVNPVLDEGGAVSGYLLVGVDVTERRTLEERLTQTQRMEAIGRLAAGIAHEINTPTQYVGDNTRFLADSFEALAEVLERYHELVEAGAGVGALAALAEQARAAEENADLEFLVAEIPNALQQSIEGIERVAEIVRAMREFSHPGTGEKIPVDLNHVIASTITVARNEWKYVAEMRTDFDASLPPVPCYSGEFNQAVLNLVTNAAHAIGEVVGSDGSRKGVIRVSTRNMGDHVEVRVADTGPGIPDVIRGRIFDPFYTTKQVGEGTGQGLAIARSVVVDRHGGSIHVESAEGEGTTFIIRLPVDEPAAAAA
jgi:PAS domain S-box-containing protein